MYKYVFLLLFCSASLFAQDRTAIDSVKVIVSEETLHDSIISNSYTYLLRHYKRNNVDSCLLYFERLKDYAERKKSSLAHYHYYRLKAGYYGLFPELSKDKYKYLTSNLHEALKYSKKTGDPKLVIQNYSRLGQEVVRLGKNEEALGYVQEALKIAEEENLWFEMAYINGQTGELYNLGFNMTEMALPFLLKSDSIYLANNYNGRRRGSTLSYLGDVYSTFGNMEEARAYQEKALAIFKELNEEFKQKLVLGKLANIESLDKNYGKAINYLLDCIAYYKDKNFPINEGIYRTLLSDVYFESNQLDKAIEIGQTGIDLNKKNNYDYGLFLALVSQSKILHANGDYTKSNELALEAEALGIALENYSNLKPVYEKLYLNAEKLGDFENAYKYSKEYKRVSDTLMARRNIQDAKELEARYKNAQQKQEIQLLQSEKELVEQQKKNQRNLLYAVIGFVFLAGLVLFFLFRNRQKTNQKLKELDTIKSNFFANISHEFRTPLTLISGPVEKQLENPKLDFSDRKDLEMVQRNSGRLLELVDQLLDLSKLESGNLKLQVKEGNISLLLRSLTAAFQYKAEKKDLDYVVVIQESDPVWFDADAIEKIVVNLLSNAFKYVPKHGKVRFSSAIYDAVLKMSIENDGAIGGAKNMDTVFTRFYQEDDHADGVGIGLALVKELVALYGGTIAVENTTKNTVLFTIELPVDRHKFSENDIIHSTSDDIDTVEPVFTDTKITSDERDAEIEADAPILLVVEDNEDIRAFVRSAFEKEYQVHEGENGAEGIELAVKLIPDIIISDIMMPKVDGMELCKTLKVDERTSHIPIILLTAKIEEQAQHEGLELGADDYVLKPFKTKLLQTRVRNMVNSRRQLRDLYSKEVVLKPSDISINAADERFIERVKKVLDEKITEESFTVEDFSTDLHMSRMQLHRKLKALTGLSASEFLRTERLKLAASLLQNKELNINEVCYKVGFSSPSYFSKCFRETFGMLPTDYRNSL